MVVRLLMAVIFLVLPTLAIRDIGLAQQPRQRAQAAPRAVPAAVIESFKRHFGFPATYDVKVFPARELLCRLDPFADVEFTVAPATVEIGGESLRVLRISEASFTKAFKLGTAPAGSNGERLEAGECSWDDGPMDTYNGAYEWGYLIDLSVEDDELDLILSSVDLNPAPVLSPKGRLTRYPDQGEAFRLQVYPTTVNGDPSKILVAEGVQPETIHVRATQNRTTQVPRALEPPNTRRPAPERP